MAGPADCPVMLSGKSLRKVLHVVYENIKNRFGLLKIFPIARYSSEEVMIERTVSLLKVASVFSSPRAGERLTTEQYAANLVKVFYFANTFDLPGNHMAAIRIPGEPQEMNLLMQDAVIRAAKFLQREETKMHIAQLRRLHLMAARILSSSTNNFQVNPDPLTGLGTTVTVDFGVVQRNSGVDWSVAGNDILSDFANMFDVFKVGDVSGPGNGLAPNMCIIPAKLRSTYIMQNTGVQALIAQTPSIGKLDLPIDLLMRTQDRVQFVEVEDSYLNPVTGLLEDVWPIDKITLIRYDAPTQVAPDDLPNQDNSNEVLEMATARTKGNDYQGWFSAHYFEKHDPESDCVCVEGNAIPVILQPQLVHIWKIA